MPHVPTVLFVWFQNAGRSQMAAAFLEAKANGRVLARSAGSAPRDRVNPTAVTAMAEVGIDMSKAVPKRLEDAGVHAADVVVTMGCGDACPVIPGLRYEDWPLPDPKDQSLASVRVIRDEIRARVVELIARL